MIVSRYSLRMPNSVWGLQPITSLTVLATSLSGIWYDLIARMLIIMGTAIFTVNHSEQLFNLFYQPTNPSSLAHSLSTLRPRQNGRHFADAIFKCIFLNENVWIPIKISLKFVPQGPINDIPAMVQIMAWRRPGDKPLSGPMMVRLPTHLCVTRPQWVNHAVIMQLSLEDCGCHYSPLTVHSHSTSLSPVSLIP